MNKICMLVSFGIVSLFLFSGCASMLGYYPATSDSVIEKVKTGNDKNTDKAYVMFPKVSYQAVLQDEIVEYTNGKKVLNRVNSLPDVRYQFKALLDNDGQPYEFKILLTLGFYYDVVYIMDEDGNKLSIADFRLAGDARSETFTVSFSPEYIKSKKGKNIVLNVYKRGELEKFFFFHISKIYLDAVNEFFYNSQKADVK